jgi:hypothetical protein
MSVLMDVSLGLSFRAQDASFEAVKDDHGNSVRRLELTGLGD